MIDYSVGSRITASLGTGHRDSVGYRNIDSVGIWITKKVGVK